jgi:predicted transcriptional regulator
MNKDVKKLLKSLEARGLRIEQSRRRAHFKVYDGDRYIVTISASPSDHRWMMNVQKTLAAAGFVKRQDKNSITSKGEKL